MYFDPKTKKVYGEFKQITPERKAFLREQVRKGIMVSTKHPSQEDIDAARKWHQTHTFNENVDEVLKNTGIRYELRMWSYI